MNKIAQKSMKWGANQLNGEIVDIYPLKGGQSSLMYLLTFKVDQAIKQSVLREYHDKDWLREEPDIAEKEATNLQVISELSIPTPELIAVDSEGNKAECPALLMSKLEGKVELNPFNEIEWLKELAETLFTIHSYQVSDYSHTYFGYYNLDELYPPNWSKTPHLWQEMINYLKATPLPSDEECFIHRDYHPTNVLWNGLGKISGVVDWANACMGPKGIDIGHCRWNLTMMYGLDTADSFLEEYEKLAEEKPYNYIWDLVALANVYEEKKPEIYAGWSAFGLHHITQNRMIERMDEMLNNALQKLD